SIIDPIQDQSFTFGQDILIKTNASDPENRIQKVEFFHGEQMIAIVTTAPYEVIWKNAPVGNYVLKAKIFDVEGLTAESARINISVIAAPAINQAPSVSIIDPIQDQSFTYGQDILIKTNASDPENKIQKVELFHGEQILATVSAAPYEFAWKNAPVGNYILKAKIFDAEDLTAESARINISVIVAPAINQAPSVSIIDPIQDQSFTYGQDILIKTNASDPENKIQKVELFHGEQIIATVSAAPYEFAWKNAPVGNYILNAKVFDDKGLTAECTKINISVISAPAVNQAPSVSIIDPIQDQSFTFGQDILIRTNATDPENKIQKVEFFYGEQMIAIVNSAPYEVFWKNAPVGNHVLKAKIFDDQNLTAESTRINISVVSPPIVNLAPSVSIIQPTQNQSFTFGQDILIRTNATDPENKIQKVEFFYGEQMIAIVNSAPYEVFWKNAPVGNHVLKAKIFDDQNLTAESTGINIKIKKSNQKGAKLKILNPTNNQVYKTSDIIPIEIIRTTDEISFDSVAIYLDEKQIEILVREPFNFEITDLNEGELKLTAKAFKSGKMIETETVRIYTFAESISSSEIKILKPSKEIQSKEQFTYSIGPNPTESNLTIFLDRLPKNEPVEIALFDMNGRTLKSIQSNTETGNITIDIGSYSAGIYFIRIIGGYVNYGTKRIMKK
ncbi:Ig-like domain-containing protein, partial [Algoriphagus sp. C2-6-M1]|uniref:T9SS type A sorting domain-containing protein n=1 Tax=Algoriphagus persicinus TaxID=3108754 RepID=UPI002B397425